LIKGANSEKARRLAAEALQLIDAAMPEIGPQKIGKGKAGPGREKKTADIISRFGTSKTYLLRRPKRDRPDLAARVVNREMSTHAA